MPEETTAVDTAPEQTLTATPEPVETQPDPVTEDQTETKPAKSFSQEEVDALIGKRLAREQRKWEREQQSRIAQTQARVIPQGELDPAQFDSPESYADALAERKAHQLLEVRERQLQQAAILDAYHEKEEEARSKYDDFEQVAYNPQVRITDVMAETIQASDLGPEIAYWLGQNPKEADRISRMAPLFQAREIGKVEAKLTADPPAKKTTSAPAPINPVSARSSSNPSYDTTDPRSVKTMSTSEWISAERERQIRKMQARNR